MSIPSDLQLGEVVYQAAHKSESQATLEGMYNDTPVIIKRSDNNLRREEAVLRRVDHLGIPKLLGYFEEDGQDLLVMERLPGVPLPRFIGLDSDWHSRHIKLKETIRIVDGLALCFEALHTAHYLYRDLNLNHIIVDKSGIGLVDHEWCITSDDLGVGQVDSQAGTWETMAPEEFYEGNRSMSRASNVYTLGVVLLQLITGKNPFFVPFEATVTTEQERLAAYKLHCKLPDIQTGHIKIDHIVRRALQPKPDSRYQSVSAFRRALMQISQQ